MSSKVVSCVVPIVHCARSWRLVDHTRKFGLYPKGLRSLRRVLRRKKTSSHLHFEMMTKTVDRIGGWRRTQSREGGQVEDPHHNGMN